MAISQKNYQFAIDLFHECFALVRGYEQQANSEIHKGAMTFNVAVAYLRANDFSAAMHYFELAQRETRATTGGESMSSICSSATFGTFSTWTSRSFP
jgi:hypothetical protein